MHPRDVVTCTQCGESIDAKAPGVSQAVTGWMTNRVQGGANMIALPERLPLWLCRHCLDKRKRGHSWDQLDLFGER